MGLLDFNIGEIASRLVRGAGVRGRVPLTLDDGVLPVVQVADYTRAPFRLDERKYHGGRAVSNSGVGVFSQIKICNNSLLPVVVEQITLCNRTALTQLILIDWGAASSAGTQAALATQEGQGGFLLATGIPPQTLPLVIFDDATLGAVVVGPSPLYMVALSASASAGSSVTIDTDLMLRPGGAVQVISQTANQPFGCFARVRSVQSVPPLP